MRYILEPYDQSNLWHCYLPHHRTLHSLLWRCMLLLILCSTIGSHVCRFFLGYLVSIQAHSCNKIRFASFFNTTVNTRYKHTFVSGNFCLYRGWVCNVDIALEAYLSRAHMPETREIQNFTLSLWTSSTMSLEKNHHESCHIDWSVNTSNDIIFALSCCLALSTHMCIRHRCNEYTRTNHRSKEHIGTCLQQVWSNLSHQHVLWRHNSF